MHRGPRRELQVQTIGDQRDRMNGGRAYTRVCTSQKKQNIVLSAQTGNEVKTKKIPFLSGSERTPKKELELLERIRRRGRTKSTEVD